MARALPTTLYTIKATITTAPSDAKVYIGMTEHSFKECQCDRFPRCCLSSNIRPREKVSRENCPDVYESLA